MLEALAVNTPESPTKTIQGSYHSHWWRSDDSLENKGKRWQCDPTDINKYFFACWVTSSIELDTFLTATTDECCSLDFLQRSLMIGCMCCLAISRMSLRSSRLAADSDAVPNCNTRKKELCVSFWALNKCQNQTTDIQWGNHMLSYLVVHIPISRQLRLCVSFFWQSPLFCHWSKDDEQCNEEQLLGLLKMHGLCAHWQSLPLQITPNSRTSAEEGAEGERKA